MIQDLYHCKKEAKLLIMEVLYIKKATWEEEQKRNLPSMKRGKRTLLQTLER